MASEDDSEVSQVRENIGCSGAPTNSDKITLAEEIQKLAISGREKIAKFAS